MSPVSDRIDNKANSSGREGPISMILIIRLVIAAILLAVSLIIKTPGVLRYILCIISTAIAGYDVLFSAINAVEAKDYFATPQLIVLVAVLAFVIGKPAEAVALVVLFKCGELLIAYATFKTKETALENLRFQSEDIVAAVTSKIEEEDALKTEQAALMHKSAAKILRFAIAFAVLFAIFMPIVSNMTYAVSIYRALAIIIVATPTSLAVAIPVSGMMGIVSGGQQGIVLESAALLEKAADVNTVVFDKSGVFTAETPRVVSIGSELIDTATFMSFASHALYYSEQSIAKAVAAINDQPYQLQLIDDFVDMPGVGVDLTIGGARVTLARRELFASRGISVPTDTADSGNVYYMTVSDKYVGKIVTSDELNSESGAIVNEIKNSGVESCILLSELPQDAGDELADQLGIDENYGQFDTAKKLAFIKDLKSKAENSVLFVYSSGIEGHSAADVDVRVGKKSKFADAYVAGDSVVKLPYLLDLAVKLKDIVTQNVFFAFCLKALLIFLSIIGFSGIWFVIFMDVVISLATILNANRIH